MCCNKLSSVCLHYVISTDLFTMFSNLCNSNSQNRLCAINTATYRSEEFDLIHRCLCIVLRTLYHLHCNKPLHPATTEKVTFANRKHNVLPQLLSQLLLNPTSGSQTQNSAVRIWSKVFIILDVPGEPHGREVTPAQFPDYMVFSIVKISYFYMVVATYMRRRCMLIR